MNAFVDVKELDVSVDKIHDEILLQKNVSLSILRLDKIDPVISGNKIFKLHYFLEDALNSTHKKVITFGGAFSNHLAATAAACNAMKLPSIGIVRGEEPSKLSETLLFCKKQNMQLKFISRKIYKQKADIDFLNQLKEEFGEHILIPEGGFGFIGVKGAQEISQHYDASQYTHICTPVGSGTTLAGIINSSEASQQIIGFSALKNYASFDLSINNILTPKSRKNYTINYDYHFGGYAKKTDQLILFMNEFYNNFKIPTDFVYTGKMMFGIWDLICKDYFPIESKILCLHTGGLQGNSSLPKGMLNF